MAPGRNDPCPCGSGRKYKHCCLRSAEAVHDRWRQVREAEGRVVPDLLHFAVEGWGKALVEAAWKRFSGGSAPLADAAADPEFETVFIPWFLFNFEPAGSKKRLLGKWPARPVALEYLDQKRGGLPDLDRQFIEAASSSPLSFALVTGVTPHREIELRDVLTGQTRRVLERSASATIRPASLLLTRVISIGEVAIMVGCAPWVIPPLWHNVIIDFREEHRGSGQPLDDRAVRGLHLEVLDFYHEIVDEMMNPRLPRVQNTDGDPLAPTTLHFELRCTPAEAFDRLKELAFGWEEADLLADARPDANGAIEAVTVPWLVAGNKLHRDWDNTSLGSLEIEKRRLTVSVNSERRAKKIRAIIAKRLGDRVLFVREETESIEAMLEHPGRRPTARERAEQEAFRARPDVREAEREMRARHWQAWLDTKVPALGDLTPREAAATPLGRERLDALLAEFAWRSEDLPPEERPDIAMLRAELGL